MALIYIINGPNLNLLGDREPEIYGHLTLNDIEKTLKEKALPLGFELLFFQSNHEGFLIDKIHEARKSAAGLIINPAAYSHTSIALFDALKTFNAPIIEVHLTNIHKREEFRHHSYVSRVAHAVVMGFGALGYEMALTALACLVDTRQNHS